MSSTNLIAETVYHLRPASEADEAFLLELYGHERKADLLLSGLNAPQRQAFVHLQFRARQASYAANFPNAVDSILCVEDGTPAGRVLVDRTPAEIRLVDIAVLPHWQRRGLATQVIQELQEECRSANTAIRLQVLIGSGAERLYEKLGFIGEGEDPLRRQMVWSETYASSSAE